MNTSPSGDRGLGEGMSLLAFWIGVAALIGLDYAMRAWTHLPHRWVSHSAGSVVGAFVIAWGVWLAVGRFGGLRTAVERRRNDSPYSILVCTAVWPLSLPELAHP